MNMPASHDGPADRQDEDAEVTPVAWDALPAAVRAAIGPSLPAGHCVCAVRYRGETSALEWIWFDEDYEPVDVIWFE